MRYRTLGSSGLVVSELGLGCNTLGGRVDMAGSIRIVHQALESGVTLFDTADSYGRRDSHAGASEEALGAALAGRRGDAIVATKFGMKMGAGDDSRGLCSGASRRYIIHAVEASLKRLKTDWIDLYQLHMPDPLTPMEETLHALDTLTRAGKIRYAGVSNLPAWQVADACHIARQHTLTGIVSCQDELSLLARRACTDLLPALSQFGLGLLPYFPLASGMLTGKYRRNTAPPERSRLAHWTHLRAQYDSPAIWDLIDDLEAFGARHGTSLPQLAFGWLLQRPCVASVIASVTTPTQLSENLASCARSLPASMDEALATLLSRHEIGR